MFLDISISLRIREETYLKIVELVNKNPDRYESESHFFRVAIMRLIQDEKKENASSFMKRVLK